MMSGIVTSSFFTIVFLVALSPAQYVGQDVKYRYFDDYLNHMDKKEKAFISGENVISEDGSGEAESELEYPGRNVGSIFNRPLPIRTGATHSKEVSCCMLGQLAGDKGYHCFVKFYAARLLFRNYNRAHNKKIPSLRRSSTDLPVKGKADKLMRTFEQCVTSRGVIFHKCCHLAAMEKNPVKSIHREKSVTMSKNEATKNGNRMKKM